MIYTLYKMITSMFYRNLSRIPPFNPNTTILECWSNRIIKIENLPEGLEMFLCFDNWLRNIENLPRSLKRLDLSHNRISKLENLPEGLETLMCNSNIIKKIENLPVDLKEFEYEDNYINYVDGVKIKRINFNLRGYQCIRRFQKRFKRWCKWYNNILENNTPSGRLESILLDKKLI